MTWRGWDDELQAEVWKYDIPASGSWIGVLWKDGEWMFRHPNTMIYSTGSTDQNAMSISAVIMGETTTAERQYVTYLVPDGDRLAKISDIPDVPVIDLSAYR